MIIYIKSEEISKLKTMQIIKNMPFKMKALIISFLFVFGFAVNTLIAQPQVVTKGLKQEFPTAKNIKWIEVPDNFWKAEFLLGGRKTSAVFDVDGHWLSTKQEIDLEEIEVEEVRAAIKKDFSSCKILSVKINNVLGLGTWYDVEGICGTETKTLSYNSYGWPWPPKIS
jgi:hypothetical protein